MASFPGAHLGVSYVEAVSLTAHERVQQRTVEQNDVFPVPQILEECFEVVRFAT